MVTGLPVLVTDVCGYANHVTSAETGIVSRSPFIQQQFNQKLHYALTTDSIGQGSADSDYASVVARLSTSSAHWFRLFLSSAALNAALR